MASATDISRQRVGNDDPRNRPFRSSGAAILRRVIPPRERVARAWWIRLPEIPHPQYRFVPNIPVDAEHAPSIPGSAAGRWCAGAPGGARYRARASKSADWGPAPHRVRWGRDRRDGESHF